MRKRIIIPISILIILILAGGFFLFRDKFKADTITTQTSSIDFATLSKLAASQPSDVPVIQLNYDKVAIETALYDYQNTKLADLSKLSAIDKEIIATLQQKRRSLVAQKQLSSDTNIILIDKKGQLVNQSPVKSAVSQSEVFIKLASTSTIADNFDFDSSVSEGSKEILIDAYPKIENFYGPRSNTKKIKVVIDTGSLCGAFSQQKRSCYLPSENLIVVNPVAISDQNTLTHELIHGFHGPYCSGSLWEEGMTESATAIILNTDYFAVKAGQIAYEMNNTPDQNFRSTMSAMGNEPYVWGSAAMYKIYTEDNNFYKKFNALLYRNPLNDDIYKHPVLIKLVSTVVPKVENETTGIWFSHQYPFVMPESDFASQPATSLATADFIFTTDKTWLYNVMLMSDSAKSIHSVGYDVNGNVLADCNFDVSAWPDHEPQFDITKCATHKLDANFKGLIKIQTTVNNDAKTLRTSYASAEGLYYSQASGMSGIVDGQADGVILANLSTNWQVDIPFSSGMFRYNDVKANQAGKYKVSVYINQRKCMLGVCKTQKVMLADHYFNKGPFAGYTTLIKLGSGVSNPKLSLDKVMNRSIKVRATSDYNCGQVLMLNGIPISRTYGTDHSFVVKNLAKGQQYAYSVMFSDNSSLGKTLSGTATTLSLSDLSLNKIEVSNDNTGKTKLYFSQPVDQNTLNSMTFLSDQIDSRVSVMVSKLDDLTYQLTPKTPLNYNATYTIEGLYTIMDSVGNPIVDDGNLFLFSYFSTLLNPATQAAPTYVLSNSSTTQSDGLTIKTNFSSADLQNHVGVKGLKPYAYLEGLRELFEADIPITIDSVTKVGSRIKTCTGKIDSTCMQYDFNDDGKIDLSDMAEITSLWQSGQPIGWLMNKYSKIQISPNLEYKPQNANATIENGSIKISLASDLLAGVYFLVIPTMIDNSNNVVAYTELQFTVTNYSVGGTVTKAVAPQVTPKVTTLPPTDITAKSIAPHGNITDIGGAPVTKRGFRLSKIQNTVQADYSDTGSFGVGAFTKTNVTLAVPNTTYYIQAYATNSAGTTYGDWVTFKSLPLVTP